MIILDLTECTEPKPASWSCDVPNKIRLIEGEHHKDYEIHPMLRQTKWYKKLFRNTKALQPLMRDDWPIGVTVINLPAKAKIIITEKRA